MAQKRRTSQSSNEPHFRTALIQNRWAERSSKKPHFLITATRKRRAKRSASEIYGLTVLFLLLAGLVLASRANTLQGALLLSIIIGVPILFIAIKLYFRWKQVQRLRMLKLEDIDSMPGHQFEQYVARLMQQQGYKTTVTKGSGDLGVDIIAEKNGIRCAVQCKRYGSNIPRTAISDAVAGKQHYKCTQAMVVTNQHFTPGAIELAKSTECILVDRTLLASWVAQFRREKDKAATVATH
jgi:HJR/Mrr/RecB family endonuclease